MTGSSRLEVSNLLHAWRSGDRAALDELVPLVHGELRRLAHHYMIRERGGHSLQSAELVNEAYLRLVDLRSIEWQDRAHFFALAASFMRRILVDHARSRKYRKRGGRARKVSLDEDMLAAPEAGRDLVKVDEALQTLAEWDERKARVVELRFFGGLTEEEAAEVLEVSRATVKRDWRLAKAWLLHELTEGVRKDDPRKVAGDRADL